MKKENAIKIFLIGIISVTWIAIIMYGLQGYIKKEGQEQYTKAVLSFPDVMVMQVLDFEKGSQQLYQDLLDKYKEDDRVGYIIPKYDRLFFCCEQLESETRRDVKLEGKLYHKMYEQYILTESVKELGCYEVLLPKYFMPCNFGRYGKENYMDGESFIGKTLTLTDDKVIYNEKDQREEVQEEQYSVEVKVVGVYDNVAMGADGKQMMYSKETYDKICEVRLGMSGEQLKKHEMDRVSNILVYPADYESKASLKKALTKEYKPNVIEGAGWIETYRQEEGLDTAQIVWKRTVQMVVIVTLVVLILFVLLMKDWSGLLYTGMWISFTCAIGLIAGTIQSYRFVQEQHKIAWAKQENITRLLEYPTQPFMITGVLAIVLLCISIIMFVVGRKWRRKHVK